MSNPEEIKSIAEAKEAIDATLATFLDEKEISEVKEMSSKLDLGVVQSHLAGMTQESVMEMMGNLLAVKSVEEMEKMIQKDHGLSSIFQYVKDTCVPPPIEEDHTK